MKMETKRKGEDMLLLGMLEDKVYGRCVREHSQSQGHLGESRVGMTRLSCIPRGEREMGLERQ